VQLTGGARYQKLHSNFVTFDLNYKDDKVTPMGGLVVKPWLWVSLYANYIEGLQEGAVAPEGTTNAGEGFPPFTTEQYEVGLKVDFGRFATTLALYQIAQPSGIIDPATNVFGVDGEQRHRGIDFNLFGEVTRSVCLLGGAAYIDSEWMAGASPAMTRKTGLFSSSCAGETCASILVQP
jgi:iron complex outermembrane receptor protein